MNTRPIIPPEVQSLIDTINAEEMIYCKQELEPHPLFPHLIRYIEIYGITPNLQTKHTHIQYRQVGVSNDNTKITLPLHCPDWYMTDTTWSYLRDPKTFDIITVPLESFDIITGEDGHPVLNTDGTPKKEWKIVGATTIPVDTHTYIKFLIRNGVSLISLLSEYLSLFVNENLDALNVVK